MKQHNAPVPTLGRQMSVLLEQGKGEGVYDMEGTEATTTLAHLLMQAAGLVVEELGDERN